jgi:hypothetical protein
VHGEVPQLRANAELLMSAGCGNVRIPAPGDQVQL